MKELSVKLKIWRQKSHADDGSFEVYNLNGLNSHMSFLEMMDVLNEDLIKKGEIDKSFSDDKLLDS